MQCGAHFCVLVLFGAVFSSTTTAKPRDTPRKSEININHLKGGRGFHGNQIGKDLPFEHRGARERNNSAKGLDAESNQQWPFYRGIGPVKSNWPFSAGFGPLRTASRGLPVSAGIGPENWPRNAGIGPVRSPWWPRDTGVGSVRTGSWDWPPNAGIGPVRSAWWPRDTGVGSVTAGSWDWPPNAGIGPVRSPWWPRDTGVGSVRTGSRDWPRNAGIGPVRSPWWPRDTGVGSVTAGSSDWPPNAGIGPVRSPWWPRDTGVGSVRTGSRDWPRNAGIGPVRSPWWPRDTGVGSVTAGSSDWPPNAGIGPVRSPWWPRDTGVGSVRTGSWDWPPNAGVGPVRIGIDGRPIQTGFGPIQVGSTGIPSQFGPQTAMGSEGQAQHSRLTPLNSIGDTLGNLLKLDSPGHLGSLNAPSFPTLMSAQRFLPLRINPVNSGEGSSYTMVFPYPSEQSVNQAPSDLPTATRAFISPGTYYPTFQGNPFGPPSYFGPPSFNSMLSPPAQQLAYSYNTPQQFYFKFPQGNQPPAGFPTSASTGSFNVSPATFKKEH